MLADEDNIEIDEKFFKEFSSDLSSEDLDLPLLALEPAGQKRDFSSFLSPWEPSGGDVRVGYGSTSPHTTDTVSECSGENDSHGRSLLDPSQKRACRLEKNRASATKCRLKKKNELNSLTVRIGELMKTLSQLTQENAALRADNASLTDHNRFLRGLVSTKPELPQYVTSSAAKTDSQQAAGAASGIAILGIFGAFSMLSGGLAGGGDSMGRVLENPLQDLLQEQAGSQLHVFIVGVFLCITLYATLSYGAQHPTVEKTALLPSHSKRAASSAIMQST